MINYFYGEYKQASYVGISNDTARRNMEHNGVHGSEMKVADLTWKQIDGIKGQTADLNRNQARAMEQVMIEANGGVKGEYLHNARNEISSKRNIYAGVKMGAEHYIKQV